MINFTSENINDLGYLIDFINSSDDANFMYEYISKYVDDPAAFLKILKSINKNKLCYPRKKNQKKEQKMPIYTKEEVMQIFESKSIAVILEEFTVKDLTSMYKSVYNTKPLSSFNKERIATTIQQYFYRMERTDILLES